MDVITIGNSGQVIYELLNNGRIFKYLPAHYADSTPEENRDPLLIQVNETIVFFYSTGTNPDGAPVSNVWELTQEQYRGRVGIKDPMASGSSLMGLVKLVQYPEKWLPRYQRLTGEELVLGDGVPDAGYEFVRRLLAGAAGAAGQDDAMIAMPNMTYISRNDSKGNVNAIMAGLDPVSRMV